MPGDINNITDRDVESFAQNLRDSRIRNAFDEYQLIATKTAVYPGAGDSFGLAYVGLKLNGEAGEFAEHVGKAFRDDKFGQRDKLYYDTPETIDLTAERHLALMKEVGDILWYLSAACNELGLRLSEVALANLQKLNDRSKRGKLSGSGDNR